MKTEFMAAATAWWLKARASARACLESKRNPYRLFRTAAVAIAVAVVIVPATVLLGDGAFADGQNESSGWDWGPGCSDQYRISHEDSDCLGVWWDNSPPVSTGVVGGSTFGAKNYCSEYGDMKANIDMKNWEDSHFHLDDSSKIRGRDGVLKIRDIECCVDKSDFCYKQQVEKDNGKIKVWSGTGTTMDTVNVSTHVKRYLYCNDNPDSIYCVNDEDGDAFTVPTLVCGPSDNRRECRARDCNWEFNHAENEYVDDYCTLDSYSYEDGFCTLDATCSSPVAASVPFSASTEIFLRHIKKKIIVCNGAEGYYLIHKDNDTCI